MKKKRLITVLLLRDGNLVQAQNFNYYQNLGNPEHSVKRLSEWGSDELIYLDISKKKYDIGRDDLKYKSTFNFLNIIKNYQLVDLWMETNLMCLGEKTSSVLNEIKWKKIFLFNPGEEEFLLYKI